MSHRATPGAAAQGACYSQDIVYPRNEVRIRDEADFRGRIVGYGRPGTELAVIGSKLKGLSCWLQVRGGWVLQSSLLSLTPVDAAAPEEGESCHLYETVYSRTKMTIRREPTLQGRKVRYTNPGEALEVIESSYVGTACWLRVRGGWLRDSALLESEQPTTKSDPVTSASSSCYPNDTAYITGAMNIRASASTDSRVVAKAQAGNSFEVTQSKRGETWCWLKISKGWMAKTGRVSSTQPTIIVATRSDTPQTAQQSEIDNCCFVDRQCNTDEEWQNGYWAYQNNECAVPSQSAAPATVSSGLPSIDGPPSFVSKAVAAFDFLRSNASNWLNYVVAKTASVGPHPFFGSRAYFARKRIQIGDTHDDDTVILASVLVHEACHLHQWDEGRWNSINVDPTRLEVECMEVQLDALLQFAPSHWFISRLRGAIQNPLVSVGS